jgi:surface protein
MNLCGQGYVHEKKPTKNLIFFFIPQIFMTTIEVTQPTGDIIQCQRQETIMDLKREIEKKTGTSWRHQQVFTTTSETPLKNQEGVKETSYYLIVKQLETIPDKDTLILLVKKWFITEERKPIYYKYGNIEEWDVSLVTDMEGVFHAVGDQESLRDSDLSSWDVSKVTNMNWMFLGCRNFYSDLSSWDVSSVESMGMMFSGCSVFDSDLSGWDVSQVKNMNYIFNDCHNFNSNLSGWKVSSVETMLGMFSRCHNFTSDLSSWDVSSVESMRMMFSGCSVFDSDLSGWDVSQVKNFNYIFSDCHNLKSVPAAILHRNWPCE